jgi:SAM-dependent methyltransferase
MTDSTEKFALWGNGIEYELAFWRDLFATSGGRWPQDFQARTDPDTEIDRYILKVVGADNIGTAKILDVGSGPISVLGKTHAGQRLDITGCDPLADYYARIAAEFSVARAIPVVKAFAEDLSAYFEPDQFDLVHCQNALDHSMEPLRAVLQMLIVAKPGGAVLLRHQLNEAENENYSGFHQWNFDAEDGHFIMWNRQQRLNVNERVEPFADVTVDKREGLAVVLRKHTSVTEQPMTDARARTRELLDGVMAMSHQASIMANMVARQLVPGSAAVQPVVAPPPAAPPPPRRSLADMMLGAFRRRSAPAGGGA